MSKGHFRCYVSRNFTPEIRALIDQANKIITEYEGRGYPLSLRQLYYQLVARDLIPNQQREYNRLGDAITNGRLAGLVSWTAIEDRGRNLRGHTTHDSPRHAMATAVSEYKIDMWANQSWHPEVWVEKQAMEGVIGHIAGELRVDFFATKGYNSTSEQWRAGQRFARYIHQGQRPIVFHLTDHDPSGFDMTEDLKSRLALFAGVPITVQRIALTTTQVHQYSPPPNPVKDTDSRMPAYRAVYGDQCWEMDALEPDVIQRVIRDAIMQIREQGPWDEMAEQEAADARVLELQLEELGGAPPEKKEETE